MRRERVGGGRKYNVELDVSLFHSRGENGPCGYKVVPVSDSKSLYIWIINTDLKVCTTNT